MSTEATRLLRLAALAALLAVAAPARAQPGATGPAPEAGEARTSDPAEAERLFHEGVRLLESGRYESAYAVLARAFELEPRASTAFNLASALHATGRSMEAHRLLVRIERGELGALPDGYQDLAVELRRVVTGALARVDVTIESPDEVDVFVDGERAGRIARGSTLTEVLPPGAHVVRAEASGFAPSSHALTLVAGAHERLGIRLEAAASASVDLAPAEPGPSDEGVDVGLAVGLTLALVALAAGAVVLGVVLGGQGAPSCDAVVGCIEF